MDTLQQMRIFVMTVRSGSFSEAGRQMDLSPASVSRYIQSLEERFGVRLLNRSSRRLSLTHAGEAFLERARSVLREFDAIEPAISEIGKGLHGRLHIHAREFVGQHLIVPLVARFLAANEGVDLVLTLSDKPLDLIENGIDVSIRTERSGEIEQMSLVARRLGSWRRVVCASPAYLARRGVPQVPTDLEQHDCLAYQFHHAAQVWRFRLGAIEEQVKVRSHVQSSSGEALRQLALAGQGIALMPEWSVAADLQKKRLVALFDKHDATPTNAPFRHNLFAVYQRSKHQTPMLRTFLQSLAELMQGTGAS